MSSSPSPLEAAPAAELADPLDESGVAPPPEVDALSRWFTRAFADLDTLNADFCEHLEKASSPEDDVVALARLGRDGIKKRSKRFLAEHPAADGVGVIFARAADAEGRGVIEWWERDASLGVHRYAFGLNPAGDRFYDYEKIEWFVMTFGSGQHWITGPYIDYLGVDEYVVTLTAQSSVHGRPVGIAGVDIQMSDLERELLPLLQRFPGRAALVTTHGSVLASNTSSLIAGDRVRPAELGLKEHPLRASGASVTVVYE